jgi:transcriptional regulator with XRE-family HTH domain
MDNSSGIGERLRALRIAGGLGRGELSRLAGLGASLIGAIETDARGSRISAAAAIALARVLGCSVEYLVLGEGERPSPPAIREAMNAARRAQAHLCTVGTLEEPKA